MNYLVNRNNKNKKKTLISYFLIFILIIFVVLSLNFFSTSVSGVLNKIALPFWKTQNFIISKFNNNLYFFRSKQSLLEERNYLKNKLDNLETMSLIYEETLSQKRELESFLNRNQVSDEVFATILSKPPISPYDSLIIDIGKNKEINEGDLVLTFENLIIGTVNEVYGKTSKVSLFSSFGFSFQAENLRTNIPIEINGRGGGNFIARIPEDSDFIIGDVIIIPNIEILVLGTVFQIEDDPTSSFKTVYIKSPINIFKLRNVIVKPLN